MAINRLRELKRIKGERFQFHQLGDPELSESSESENEEDK
jgi:hypothetical protein